MGGITPLLEKEGGKESLFRSDANPGIDRLHRGPLQSHFSHLHYRRLITATLTRFLRCLGSFALLVDCRTGSVAMEGDHAMIMRNGHCVDAILHQLPAIPCLADSMAFVNLMHLKAGLLSSSALLEWFVGHTRLGRFWAN